MSETNNIKGLKYYHIVSVNKLGGIGVNGSIPWKSAADMAHFKATTMHQIVIVGRKTYDSLPSHKLKGRHLIVVSNTLTEDVPEHVVIARSLQEAYLHANLLAQDWALTKAFIAGGAKIYNATSPIIDGVILTSIDDSTPCDVFYAPYHLKHMTPIMNKSLEDVNGEVTATVHEYAVKNIFE